LTSRADLKVRLDAVAASQSEVMIQATRLVHYGNVLAVLASVQRHGITCVGVVQGA
jgi:biopolymer transport protein ExbD